MGSCGAPLSTQVLITECHKSYKHSQSSLTNFSQKLTFSTWCDISCEITILLKVTSQSVERRPQVDSPWPNNNLLEIIETYNWILSINYHYIKTAEPRHCIKTRQCLVSKSPKTRHSIFKAQWAMFKLDWSSIYRYWCKPIFNSLSSYKKFYLFVWVCNRENHVFSKVKF